MTAELGPRPSPFFETGSLTTPDSLAILHLKRDQLVPVLLQSSTNNADGYVEGAVTNTRFGSFPHSTLVGLPWGSQVRASKVDTGSRGRKATKPIKEPTSKDASASYNQANQKNGKRKRDDGSEYQESDNQPPKAAITAGTGFVHILPPTPESWTLGLPHRTQVVYTPDSSYVLQRLRVRPGDTIIEAGAGSGSFTHAAARAVFNGHATASHITSVSNATPRSGKVCSFEYHEPRAIGLRKEIHDHGLEGVVKVTHRDVYRDGFNLLDSIDTQQSPRANAIFLDLPAPWLALKHLTRSRVASRTPKPQSTNPPSAVSTPADSSAMDLDQDPTPTSPAASQENDAFISPLDPTTSVHLCTFSPCIEQVQSTVSALRKLGWTEIDTVTVEHKRLDIRRERVGLHEQGLRGVNASAATVEEAVARLREVESRFKDWTDAARARGEDEEDEGGADATKSEPVAKNIGWRGAAKGGAAQESRQQRLDRIKREFDDRKIYKEGKLVHRTEPEIKTHTSYLVFAVLPREWSAEDEERCLQDWGTGPLVTGEEATAKKVKGAMVNGGGGKKAKKGKQG